MDIAVTTILSNSSPRPRLGVDYIFSLSKQEEEEQQISRKSVAWNWSLVLLIYYRFLTLWSAVIKTSLLWLVSYQDLQKITRQGHLGLCLPPFVVLARLTMHFRNGHLMLSTCGSWSSCDRCKTKLTPCINT